MGYVYGASRGRRPSTGVTTLIELDDEWRQYLYRNLRAREEYARTMTELERNPRGTAWGRYTAEQRRRYLNQQAARRRWRYENEPEYRARALERNRSQAVAQRARRKGRDQVVARRSITHPGQVPAHQGAA